MIAAGDNSPPVSIGSRWTIGCGRPPKEEVIFFSQVILIYIVVLACLANLSFGEERLQALWISLVSGCIGYILPAPKISKNESLSSNAAQ